MSRNVKAAQAVTDLLNAFAQGQGWTATRKNLVVNDPKDMGDNLHVDVVPLSDTADGANRRDVDHELAVGVAIRQRLDASKTAQENEAIVDGLIELAEQIADHLSNRHLTDPIAAGWKSTQHEPVLDRARLYTQRTFVSQITVRYQL